MVFRRGCAEAGRPKGENCSGGHSIMSYESLKSQRKGDKSRTINKVKDRHSREKISQKKKKPEKCCSLRSAALPMGSMYFQLENLIGGTSHSLWRQKL